MVHNPEDFVFDAWTPLSFKRALGKKGQGGNAWFAPTWVGDHDRRLQAYKVLQSYYDNSSRLFLQTTNYAKMDAYREYGDAALIADQIKSAVLGEEQEIFVDGAEDFTPEGENSEEEQAAADLQDWLRDWADSERFGLKMNETERNACVLGDGLYTLGWDPVRRRGRLRLWDPGFYFPVLHDGNEDDFPDTVHVAWEFTRKEQPDKTFIRRLTWKLDELPGGGTRKYEWNDESSNLTCLFSDATFVLEMGRPETVENLSPGSGVYEKIAVKGSEVEVRDLDMQIDFLPVVHIPNTISLLNHFGRSSLSSVLQILNDLGNADTDLQAASATTGNPVLGLQKASMGKEQPTYRPGEILETGDGKLDYIDTSRALDALLKYVAAMLERAAVNARLPESVLGRVSPADVPSGVALALSFGPLASMVEEMRQVRAEKYMLLMRFVQRLALASGQQDVPKDFITAGVRFGAFLPQDLDAVVNRVTTLLTTKPAAISLETAVAMLQEAGLPIEDAQEEVNRIQHRDFVGAVSLLEATGEPNEVGDYLDRSVAPAPVAPVAPEIPTPPVLPEVPTPPVAPEPPTPV